MPPRKNAQRHTSGCRVCGNPNVGRGIVKHLEGAHGKLKYRDYKKCFDGYGTTVVDKMVQTGTMDNGTKRVIMHVFVRKFIVPVE